MGKVWIIADTTYRETARQPIFYILVGCFAAIIYLSRYFTLFSFEVGDEANMIREMGIASITVCGILLAVVMSSVSITSEVERLTTLMVLSKPVGRGQFLVGKYLGLMMSVLFGVIFLSTVFLYTLWVKEIRPALERETNIMEHPDGARVLTHVFPTPAPASSAENPDSSQPSGSWPIVLGAFEPLNDFLSNTVPPVFKGALLSFIQIAILAALAVGIAPHFSLVVNAATAFVLFAIGHLTQYIHLQAETASAVWSIPARVLYVLLPNLAYFNAANLLATRTHISGDYLALSSAYGVFYIVIALLVANVFFSRKEVR